jgi:hypothetical protein
VFEKALPIKIDYRPFLISDRNFGENERIVAGPLS